MRVGWLRNVTGRPVSSGTVTGAGESAGAGVAAGAEARFGEKATLVRGAQAWEVAVGAERVRATTIIVAAGLGGMAARLGITGRPQRRRMIAQQWFQPAAPPLPAVGEVEMHWLRGGYVGLATPAPGRCVVALSAEAPRDGESAWDHLHRLNPTATVWSLLSPDALRRYGAKGTAGFPWWPQQLGIANVLLVGDAAGYDEPFTGEGMGQALSSGLCAAEAILRGGDILQHYTKLMRSQHVPVRRRLRWISRILRWGFLNSLASKPVLLPPSLLAPIVRWVHVGA